MAAEFEGPSSWPGASLTPMAKSLKRWLSSLSLRSGSCERRLWALVRAGEPTGCSAAAIVFDCAVDQRHERRPGPVKAGILESVEGASGGNHRVALRWVAPLAITRAGSAGPSVFRRSMPGIAMLWDPQAVVEISDQPSSRRADAFSSKSAMVASTWPQSRIWLVRVDRSSCCSRATHPDPVCSTVNWRVCP